MAFSSLGYPCPPLEVARLKSLSLLRTDFEPDRVKMKHESPPGDVRSSSPEGSSVFRNGCLFLTEPA